MPSRRSIIFDVIGEKGLTNALALDSIGMHGSRMLGPTMAGFLITIIGVSAGYGIASLFYAISMFLIILVRVPAPQIVATTATNILSNIAQGFQYALSNRIILSVIVITIIMNLMCFSYLQMIPVIARDKLGVGPGLMGLLMGGDGLGSIIGATAIASASRLRRLGRVFLIGSTLGFIMTFCFSMTTSFALAYPFLLLLGICVAGFGTLQSIIVISSSSPDMRGRALGIVTLAIGFGPLGALAIGVFATATTPSYAIMIFSIVGIILVLIVAAFSRGLRSQTTALS
jgi:MFS family permease